MSRVAPLKMSLTLAQLDKRLQAKFQKVSVTDFKSVIAFIRRDLTEAIQEACALLPVSNELLVFFSRVLFAAVKAGIEAVDAFLLSSERVQVIAAWHALHLADCALKPYLASFLFLFEGRFVSRLTADLDAVLPAAVAEASIPAPGQVTTPHELAQLNRVIDAVNVVRLCPPSKGLEKALLDRLPLSVRPWVAQHLE